MSLVPIHIRNLRSYKPGKPIDEVQKEFGLRYVIKLASNENPLGVSKKVIEAVLKNLNKSHRYPDTTGLELRSTLAERFNLKIENVILGAGSESIMSNIMRTFLSRTDEIVAVKNSFIGFRVLANASGVKTNWIPMKNYRYDLQSLVSAVNNRTKIIYLANPDNPMGTYFSVDEFDEFMKHIPQRVLVILDEAYFEYAQDIPDYPDSMRYRYDNVITLRTFSKIYGLAGFRVGYGFAREELIGNLLKVKLPFEPSSPAQIAAVAALKDSDYLEKSRYLNQTGMVRLTEFLSEEDIRFIPSAANFITMVFQDSSMAAFVSGALLRQGIIVRNLSGFGWPDCIRVTIGTESEVDFLIGELKKIISEIYIGV